MYNYKVDGRKTEKNNILELLAVFYRRYKRLKDAYDHGPLSDRHIIRVRMDEAFEPFSDLKSFIRTTDKASEYEIDVALYGLEHANKLHDKE
jgi:hypothetical protein